MKIILKDGTEYPITLVASETQFTVTGVVDLVEVQSILDTLTTQNLSVFTYAESELISTVVMNKQVTNKMTQEKQDDDTYNLTVYLQGVDNISQEVTKNTADIAYLAMALEVEM